MNDTLTAALYLRAAATNDDAIADQRARCTNHAISAGYSLGEVFVDNGASGLRDRPGLAALRACIEAGRAQVVVATDPDRIARDFEFLLEQERFLEGNNIVLVYADPPGGRVTSEEFLIQLRRLPTYRAAATRAREAQ